MRRLAVPAVLLALAGAAPAAAAPATTCPGLSAKVDTFARYGPPLSGWVENMGFDGRGGMWLSTFDGRMVRLDAQGRPSTSFTIDAPGASLPAPDGKMYVDFGNSMNAAAAGIQRFDPTAAAPKLEPFATGAAMANGLARDGAGNFYIGDTSAGVVQKVRPDGTLDPGFRVPAPGADGVVVTGDSVYVAQLSDLPSTITRIPLADPEGAKTLATLGDDGVPKLLDDLDVGPDGALYVTSALGFLYRVDPISGAACTLLAGLAPLTSARFPQAFAPYDARKGDLFLSSEAGQVYHARISGLTLLPEPTPAPAPAMRLTLRPTALRAHVATTIRATVRSAARSCRAGVTVRLGRRTVRTDAKGRATLRYTPAAAGARTVTAAKPGCARTSARLRVR